MQSQDNIRAYLNEIGRIPMVDAKQEVDLAIKIQAGLEAEERIKQAEEDGVAIDRQELRRLTRIQTIGKDAREKLVEANLRLVVSIARHYSFSGLTMLDLIQEGNLGLIRAVEKFDHTKGFKFSTYATWWIKQGIVRGIHDKARTIRVPEHLMKAYNRIQRASAELVQDTGEDPTPEQIAEKLEIKTERVEEIIRIFQSMISLDAPTGEDGDSFMGDFLSDDQAVRPEDSADKISLEMQMDKLFNSLKERERRILRLRFGFEDNHRWTLDEIGREFGLTRERIRQIEAKALMKVRQSEHVELLREFI